MVEDTHRRRNWPARSLLGSALAVVALIAFAAPAAAIPVPGENGRIVLSSGRNLGETARELFLLPVPSSTGGGTISAPIASIAGQHHRHPAWSPDRTKIVYARAANGTPPFELWVQDLTQPLSITNPTMITNVNGLNKDRPAWSPDGRHIAWEQSSGALQRDIIVALPNGGGQQNITNSAGFEGDPTWSPDSNTMFYESGNAFTENTTNIVKRSISGTAPGLTLGGEAPAVTASGIAQMQPSVSPNGDRICFTARDAGGGNPTGDVLVAPLTTPTSGGSVISFDLAAADYNCAFSPDNTQVAWVNGTGNNAASLVMARADDTSLSPITLADDPGGDNFDGNPDWAPDGRPECADATAEVKTGVRYADHPHVRGHGPAVRAHQREGVPQRR